MDTTLASGAAIFNLFLAYLLIKSPVLMAVTTGVFGGAMRAILPDYPVTSSQETVYKIVHTLVFIGFVVLIFMSYPFLTAIGVYILSAVISVITYVLVDIAKSS